MSEKIDQLLTQGISTEITRIGYEQKLRLYNIDPHILFPTPPPGEETADLIPLLTSLHSTDLQDPHTLILSTIGWEFVWGAGKPPKQVDQKKQWVKNRAQQGKNLTDEEKFLLILSQIDTDMF